MSFVHHEPDLAIVGCVACGDLVDVAHQVRDTGHFYLSCCYWHPYHSWCCRAAPPDPRSWMACADCGESLAMRDVVAAARWLTGFKERLHRKAKPPETNAPGTDQRPAALRFVRVRQRGAHEPQPITVEPLFDGAERETHAFLGQHFELVHASACTNEPPIVARLRAARDDIDLRLAYAHELEQAGDTERAEFVRHDAARRRGEHVNVRDERLRNMRASLPSTWREAVAKQ